MAWLNLKGFKISKNKSIFSMGLQYNIFYANIKIYLVFVKVFLIRSGFLWENYYAGNDTVSNSGQKVTIDAGDGNNDIFINSSNVSVKSGAGNDTITSEGNNENVSIDDDVVSKNAIINLIDGSRVQSTLVSGNEIILKIGSGSITIKDGATKQSILSDPLGHVMMIDIPRIEKFATGFNALTGEFKTTFNGEDIKLPIKKVQLKAIDKSALGNTDFAGKLENVIKEIQTTINGIDVKLPVNNVVISSQTIAIPQIDFSIPQLKDIISSTGVTMTSIDTTIDGFKFNLPLTDFQMPVIDLNSWKPGTGFNPIDYSNQIGYEEIYKDQSCGARLIIIGNHVKKKSKVTNTADGAIINGSGSGNDNNRNSITTGPGRDYVFNNDKNTLIDTGDDHDDIYNCPNFNWRGGITSWLYNLGYFKNKGVQDGLKYGGVTFDNVVLEGTDFVTSFIPIPVADMAAASALRTGYMVYRHGSDVDVAATFFDNLNPFSTSDSQ